MYFLGSFKTENHSPPRKLSKENTAVLFQVLFVFVFVFFYFLTALFSFFCFVHFFLFVFRFFLFFVGIPPEARRGEGQRGNKKYFWFPYDKKKLLMPNERHVPKQSKDIAAGSTTN